MLEVLPFVEDPDLSGSAAPALPQLLPPCQQGIINLSSVSIALFFTALIYVNIFNEGRGEGKLIISQPKNIFLHFFSILVPGSGHITLFAG